MFFQEQNRMLLIESFDGNMYVNVLDTIYIMKEIPKHEKHSREFDWKIKEKKPKKKYIPPLDYPWRNDDFLGFLTKQKHRQNGANV